MMRTQLEVGEKERERAVRRSLDEKKEQESESEREQELRSGGEELPSYQAAVQQR